MRLSSQSLTVRSPRLEDAQQTLELMIRCDLSEYGQPDSDLDDLLHDWKQIDLQRDAWLVYAPENELVGYGVVVPWGNDLRLDVYVEPTWTDEDLGSALLELCESRCVDIVTARDDLTSILAKTYLAHSNALARRVFERSGFQCKKHHFNMQIDFDAPPATPSWPEGVSVRNALPSEDDGAIHALIQIAFDRPGREAQPFEAWQRTMKRADLFDASLWFVAVAEDEIVGACLCVEYTDSQIGWVRQLAVNEKWRRKGVGIALLRTAFVEFERRGYAKAGLAVEATNQHALDFYRKAGMRQIRQYDEYAKQIGA